MPSINLAKKLLHDPHEEIRSILGQGFLASIMQESSLSKSTVVLSNKRLYQTGRVLEVQNSRLVYTTGTAVVSVRDITGTRYRTIADTSLLAKWFLATLLCALVLVASKLLGLLLLLCSILAGPLIVFRLMMVKLLVVEYAGGAVGIRCDWYPTHELENFQREISCLKDSHEK